MENDDSKLGEYAAAPAGETDASDDGNGYGFEAKDSNYGPVPVRYRHDGWVPDRQLEFIEALGECGCVETAAKAVGMSRTSAYALRRRADAQAFRLAWDAAMDYSVGRLSDAAMARAIHGVPVPIYHAGQQVGERRHFDERLTMFLLRYRDPGRYGKWHDGMQFGQEQDAPSRLMNWRVTRMIEAAWRYFEAAMRGEKLPMPEPEILTPNRLGGEGAPR